MHFRVKPTLLYLLFVGVPLLGVLWVLRLGRAVTPTMSVGGHWDVAAQASAASAAPCAAPVAQPNTASAFDIVQSGKQLTLASPNGLGLRGGIDHDVVTATYHPGQRPVRLDAKVDRAADPETLHGTVEFLNCPSAPGAGNVTMPIQATRTQSSRSGAR